MLRNTNFNPVSNPVLSNCSKKQGEIDIEAVGGQLRVKIRI